MIVKGGTRASNCLRDCLINIRRGQTGCRHARDKLSPRGIALFTLGQRTGGQRVLRGRHRRGLPLRRWVNATTCRMRGLTRRSLAYSFAYGSSAFSLRQFLCLLEAVIPYVRQLKIGVRTSQHTPHPSKFEHSSCGKSSTVDTARGRRCRALYQSRLRSFDDLGSSKKVGGRVART